MYRIKIEKKKEIKKLRYTEINDSPSLFFYMLKCCLKASLKFEKFMTSHWNDWKMIRKSYHLEIKVEKHSTLA